MKVNDDQILERLKLLSSTLLADSMDYEKVMNYEIKPVNYKNILVGQARTVSVYPGDNLYLHHGIYEANPEEILVVEGKGSTVSAYIGNLMASAAEKLGIKGIIIDGLVRDKSDLENMDIQIYATGFTPKGPKKNGPGSFDVPIQCGGVIVNPYDFVIADEDGVTVIPYQNAEKYVEKAEKKLLYEEERLKKITRTEINNNSDKHSIEPSWLRESMQNQ
ncbi:RraA family protein [Mammaliicoccus lentus]|jgi:4-hydroxy-4-methyl-2-oxoglutarate aldolase|uniref:Putative 4-hydroxy-4-methyl-2-oxoglutarate aldolase n=1 Tax=Mammaliicoccus lentus TaxID=42858 RepID=A0AAX3W5H5_MAMLE|nr:RraA family protein [Mammaliicoccus lentus]WHI60439.1 RraA family protein [Mammaliicoccus lentus]